MAEYHKVQLLHASGARLPAVYLVKVASAEELPAALNVVAAANPGAPGRLRADATGEVPAHAINGETGFKRLPGFNVEDDLRAVTDWSLFTA